MDLLCWTVVDSPGQRRMAAKVILLDTNDAVLLFCGGDPSRPEAGTWWFMPGGGLEPGETFEQAAKREVREETGFVVDELGPIIRRRNVDFRFVDEVVHADEVYFLVRVTRFEVDSDGWTELERESIIGHRWWTIDELRRTNDKVFPEGLADLIQTHSSHRKRPRDGSVGQREQHR